MSCDLPAGDPAIDLDTGSDAPDDALRALVSPGGVILQKCFYRQSEATACVDYYDYRRVEDSWLAHRIVLEHKKLPYSLNIALIEADPGFDTTAVFGESR